MDVKERIAYVRGLIEGSEFHGGDERAQSIWANLLSICDSMADSISSLWESVEDTEEYLEAIDLDLSAVEEATGMADDVVVEIKCDACGEEFYVDERYVFDNTVGIACPTCGDQLDLGDNQRVVGPTRLRNGSEEPFENDTNETPQ